MRTAEQIVFTKITGSDFFNIYKARGQELRGGGQSYIDFSTAVIPIEKWARFFEGFEPTPMTHGPRWDITINSLGLGRQQDARIYQRRPASLCITAQKLQSASAQGNRIYAWHPEHTEFPQPATVPTSASDPVIAPLIINLVIYIIRDEQSEFWAGWFQQDKPLPNWACPPSLRGMFSDAEGYIELTDDIPFDETDRTWPFGYAIGVKAAGKKPERERTEEESANLLFDGDIASGKPIFKAVTTKVRNRNIKAIKTLKKLYGKCQITGDTYVFKKSDGSPYIEAHHLIPLGEGGADAPHNLVIVSAHIHRMLHYADVSEIDFSKMDGNKLEISINSINYTITWHPKHAKLVESAATGNADEM